VAMEIDGDRPPPPPPPSPWQPPCPVCGREVKLDLCISAVPLDVIRLLSEGMRDKVDALLGERGLQLPRPGEGGARPLLIRCCKNCCNVTTIAKKRAQNQLSWSRRLDGNLYPARNTRFHGERVRPFTARCPDDAFVFRVETEGGFHTAKQLLDKYNKGGFDVSAKTFGDDDERDFKFQKGDVVEYPAATSPTFCEDAGRGLVVGAEWRQRTEWYTIKPVIEHAKAVERPGRGLRLAVQDEGPTARRHCTQRPCAAPQVSIDALQRENQKLQALLVERDKELTRVQCELEMQKKRSALSTQRAKVDRRKLHVAAEVNSELGTQLAATQEIANRQLTDVLEDKENAVAILRGQLASATVERDSYKKRAKVANSREKLARKSAQALQGQVRRMEANQDEYLGEVRAAARSEAVAEERNKMALVKAKYDGTVALMQREVAEAQRSSVKSRTQLMAAMRDHVQCFRALERTKKLLHVKTEQLAQSQEATPAVGAEWEVEADESDGDKADARCSTLLAILGIPVGSAPCRSDSLPKSSALIQNPNSRARSDLRTYCSQVTDGMLGLFGGSDGHVEERQRIVLEELRDTLDKRLRTTAPPRSPGPATTLAMAEGVISNIRQAWVTARVRQDKAQATQLLSLLPGRTPGVSWADVRSRMSVSHAMRPGDPVVVRHERSRKFGVCVSCPVDPKAPTAVYVVAPPPHGMTPPDGLKALVAARVEVAASDIHHAEDLRCSERDTRTAAQHQSSQFPGAPVVPRRRRPYVARTSPREKAVILRMFTSPAFVAIADGGQKNARRGIEFMLKMSWPEMTKEVNLQLQAADLPPVTMPTLRRRVGPMIEVLKGDNCCCPTCKHMGWVAYDELSDLVRTTFDNLGRDTEQDKAVRDHMLRRIEVEKGFRMCRFRFHLENSSCCPHHCLNCRLSSDNVSAFAKPCSHGRSDGSTVEPLPTTSGLGIPRHTTCMYCGDTAKGRGTTCCSFCGVVCHNNCGEKWCGDFEQKGGSFICRECSAERSLLQHDTRCFECERHAGIMDDVRYLIDQTVEEAKSGDLTDRPKHLAHFAEFAKCRLKELDVDLGVYHAHLVRTVNQECYKRVCQKLMALDGGVWALGDYWAKQGERSFNTALCEQGKANRTVSVYGQYILYPNATMAEREGHRNVPWEKYPPAPDDPHIEGPKFLHENFRAFSDSSRQTVDHSQQTIEAVLGHFFASRPWLKKQVWFQSDGASNFHSTRAAVLMMASKSITATCISTEGEGKGAVDADNGCAQHAIRASQTPLTNAGEFRDQVQKFQRPGQTNATFEPRPTPPQQCARETIPNISDLKMRCVVPGGIRLWESFDEEKSLATRRPVGRGPGLFISRQDAEEKYGLDHDTRTPAKLEIASDREHEDGDSFFEPAAKLSSEQVRRRNAERKERQAARQADAAHKRAALDEKTARCREAVGASPAGTFKARECPKCGKSFRSERRWLEHTRAPSGCSTSAAKNRKLQEEKRQTQSMQAGIRAGIQESVDLTELCLARQNHTPDHRAVTFPCDAANSEASLGLGFVIGAGLVHPDGTAAFPSSTLPETVVWQTGRPVGIGKDKLAAHVPAHVIFEDPQELRSMTRVKFGFDWRKARAAGILYQKKIRRKVHWFFRCMWPSNPPNEVDLDLKATHVTDLFSNVHWTPWTPSPEHANSSPWCIDTLPPVVTAVTRNSLAERHLVRPGLTVVSVQGNPVRTLAETRAALRHATRDAQSVQCEFVLPRPPPHRRGDARQPCHPKLRTGLDIKVKNTIIELSKDPALAGRTRKIHGELVKRIGYGCTDVYFTHLTLVPPERATSVVWWPGCTSSSRRTNRPRRLPTVLETSRVVEQTARIATRTWSFHQRMTRGVCRMPMVQPRPNRMGATRLPAWLLGLPSAAISGTRRGGTKESLSASRT